MAEEKALARSVSFEQMRVYHSSSIDQLNGKRALSNITSFKSGSFSPLYASAESYPFLPGFVLTSRLCFSSEGRAKNCLEASKSSL